MRSVRVPAAMAVCAEPRSHYVITAVDACRSFQQYVEGIEESARHPTTGRPSCTRGHRFRLDGLLPADWSSLLAHCRALSHPLRAFNFSSPGDIGVATGSAGGERRPPTVENGAYMHVVERVSGDFVPNNMIYHQLQKYSLHAKPDTASEAVAGFARLVRDAQALPPQLPADAAALAPTAGGTLSLEEKAKLDPLANNEDALRKSSANAAIDIWAANSNPESDVFTFYPFPCPVAASIPYRSRHFCVMVNLKPIVPNHMMVVPLRCVGTVHALTSEEVEDWGRTVSLTVRVLNEARRREAAKNVSSSLEERTKAGNYSVAIQQGELAGQTVPHLHTHIIPFDPNGKLAGEPESEEREQQRRPPRTVATMKEETEYLKLIFKELKSTL